MIRHIAGLAEIVDDVEAAVRFYRDVLGLAVEREADAPYANVIVPGTLHFGIWSRAAAAESVYGEAAAAARIPLGFTVAFEVDAVSADTEALQARGWQFVQHSRTEPWGQTTARFFSPSGALAEISETPWARRITGEMKAEAAESSAG